MRGHCAGTALSKFLICQDVPLGYKTASMTLKRKFNQHLEREHASDLQNGKRRALPLR